MNLYRKCLLIWVVLGLVAGAVSAAPVDALWLSAESIRENLFQAQLEMFSARTSASPQSQFDNAYSLIEQAYNQYQSDFQADVQAYAPTVDEALNDAFELALKASSAGDDLALSSARGHIWTALLWASHDTTLALLNEDDVTTSEEWLRIREFRQSTRVSLVDNKALQAIDLYLAEQIKLPTALLEVGNDLRDTYFYRLRTALGELESAIDKGFSVRAAEWMGQVSGYYHILQADYAFKLGDEQASALNELLQTSEALILDGQLADVSDNIQQIRLALSVYQPIILTDAEIAQRVQMLYMFTSLIKTEYLNAVRDGKITIPVEYQESQTFTAQARSIFEEVQTHLSEKNLESSERINHIYLEIESIIQSIGSKEQVAILVEEALAIFETDFDVNSDSTALSVFPLIDVMLDEVVQAVADQNYETAEQLRLEAYALFDFGPEPRLMAFSPDLQIHIEGLFWQGHNEILGLAKAIESKASVDDIQAIRNALGIQLHSAQVIIGESSSEPLAIITNAAVIVFREGLEAVVILAALVAGMVGANERYRRPLVAGSVLALIATFVTWGLMQGVLSVLKIHGEKLEAIVSIVAIIILLLITNWFFHKVYWNEWIARFHRQKKSLMGREIEIGQTMGLVLLGFTSVYREGFETVLFLQALVLDAGLWVVVQGVLLGSLGIMLVGYATFRLQKRLPYRRMLVWTGILIGLVLVTMVGHTVHVLQVVGWMPISPISGVELPVSLGVWLGTFPTWQGILLQIGAAGFVIGSYYLAEWHSKNRRESSQKSLTQA